MPRDLIDWDRIDFLIQEQYAQAHVKEPEEFTNIASPTPDRSWVTTEDIHLDRRLSPVARFMSEGGYLPTPEVKGDELPELDYNERWKVSPTEYPEVKVELQRKGFFGLFWHTLYATYSDPTPKDVRLAAISLNSRKKKLEEKIRQHEKVSGIYPPKRLSDV